MWTAGGLDDGTRFHTARVRMPGLEAFAPGYVMPPDGGVEQIDVCTAEEELGEHGFPTSARVECGPARHGHRAALLQPRAPVDDDGSGTRHARFPRALCRFETADGRSGVGWTEWNQPTT